ncbi:MAG: LarC family nickel insertion protein [Halanaerobium sp.]
MKDILYFDINSGISGDMTIASLLDLGVDQGEFLEELKKLNLAGYEVVISTVQKNGITASDFKVVLEDDSHPDHVEAEHEHNAEHGRSHSDHSHEHHHEGGCNGCGNHDHDGEHSHSHHEHDHSHEGHSHENNNHSHGPGHSHSHSSGTEHIHRNFNDIKNLINQSVLSQKVKDLSIDIFAKVAEAEAKVHNKEINEVHFHEVGAVDSIVDIVGTAILIEMLNPDHIYASPVSLGTGFVDAAHGRIPVPAPATIEILKDVPVYSSGVKGELVTPTGAAIIKTLAEEFMPLPELEISKIAYGAGKKDFEITNLLRVYQAKKKLKKSY